MSAVEKKAKLLIVKNKINNKETSPNFKLSTSMAETKKSPGIKKINCSIFKFSLLCIITNKVNFIDMIMQFTLNLDFVK